MKKSSIIIFLCSLSLCLSAKDLVITELNPSPIIINKKKLKVGDVFSDTDNIEWTSSPQDMKAKPKSGGIPRHYSAEAFRSKSKRSLSINQYLQYLKKPKHLSVLSGSINLHRANNAEKFPEKRIALIIGNSNYAYITPDLDCPISDAEDVSKKLNELGFDTFTYYDANTSDMYEALKQFKTFANGYDVALFYYVGHGSQNMGLNYLLPSNAKNIEEEDINDWISFDNIFETLSETNCKTKLAFLDACRNEPAWKTDVDATRIDREKTLGTLIVYSTSNGETAYGQQSENERNTPFGASFLQFVDKPFNNVNDAIQQISENVKAKTLHIAEQYGGSPTMVEIYGVGHVDFTFYNEINLKHAAQAATQAHELYYSKGQPKEAMELLYNNMPHNQYDLNKPYSFDVDNELRRILNDTISPFIFLYGHKKAIKKFYFSKDSENLITLGSDSVVIIWDVNTGRQLHKMNGVDLSCISSDLKYVVLKKSPTEYNIYETLNGKFLPFIDCGNNDGNGIPIRLEIGFTKDDKHIYTFQKDLGLSIWDIENSKLIAKKDIYYSKYWCDLSKDGSLLAFIDKDEKENILELWDLKNNKLIFSKSIKANKINQAVFSADDKNIFTIDDNGDIIKWDLKGEIKESINLGKPLIKFVEFDNSSSNIIVQCKGGYALASMAKKCLTKIFANTYMPFFANDKVITIRDDDYKLWEVWDANNGELIAEFGPYLRRAVTSVNQEKELALITQVDGKLALYNLANGKLISFLHQRYSFVDGALVSPNGSFIATTNETGNIVVWKIKEFKKQEDTKTVKLSSRPFKDSRVFIEENHLIINSQFDNIEIINLENNDENHLDSKSGCFAVSNGKIFVAQDECIDVYDILKQNVVKKIPINDVQRISVSKDKSSVGFFNSNGALFIYDINNQSLTEYSCPENNSSPSYLLSEFSHDNTFFVACDLSNLDNLIIWTKPNNHSYRQVHIPDDVYQICSLDTSPIDNMCIAMTHNKCFFINLATGEVVSTIEAKGKGFASAFFHPNKNIISYITYDRNNNVHIINASNCEEIKTLTCDTHTFRYGAFSQDGKVLYTIGFLGQDKNTFEYKLVAWNVEDWRPLFTRIFDSSCQLIGEYDGNLGFYRPDENAITLEPVHYDKLLTPTIDIIEKTKFILNNN